MDKRSLNCNGFGCGNQRKRMNKQRLERQLG